MLGTFALRTGQIRVGRPVEQSSVTAVLAADSFTTGNSRRDEDVRSAKFLDATAHPDITFTSDRLQHVGGTWTVSGTLCAHGISRPLQLVVDRAHCSGSELSLHVRVRIQTLRNLLTKLADHQGLTPAVHPSCRSQP